jgi:hypothetical protein
MNKKLHKIYDDLSGIANPLLTRIKDELPYEKVFTILGAVLVTIQTLRSSWRILRNISMAPESL